MDPDTGELFVHFTTSEVLDRDGEEPEHRIIFTIVDNLEGAGGIIVIIKPIFFLGKIVRSIFTRLSNVYIKTFFLCDSV